MLAFNYQFNKNGAGWNIDTITYENNYLSNPFYIKTVSNPLGIFFSHRTWEILSPPN
jgi:hypothetical protein